MPLVFQRYADEALPLLKVLETTLAERSYLVGESFSEIFFGNSLMIGLPCVTSSPEHIRDLIEQMTRAMGRIDEGNYGICERCGNPIDAARSW